MVSVFGTYPFRPSVLFPPMPPHKSRPSSPPLVRTREFKEMEMVLRFERSLETATVRWSRWLSGEGQETVWKVLIEPRGCKKCSLHKFGEFLFDSFWAPVVSFSHSLISCFKTRKILRAMTMRNVTMVHTLCKASCWSRIWLQLLFPKLGNPLQVSWKPRKFLQTFHHLGRNYRRDINPKKALSDWGVMCHDPSHAGHLTPMVGLPQKDRTLWWSQRNQRHDWCHRHVPFLGCG